MGRTKLDDDEKANPNDRITCDICGSYYTRSNKSKHLTTKLHKMAEKYLPIIEKQENEIKLHKAVSASRKQRGGNEKDKHRRKLLKRLHDSDTEEEDYVEEKVIPKKPIKNNQPMAKLPKQINDYITQTYGKIYVMPDFVAYLNDNNVTDDEKYDAIDDYVEKSNRIKNPSSINNNVNFDVYGNPEEIKKSIWNATKF